MKYGQLIEYNMRTIYHKNHTQNAVEKLFPDPVLKNQNWAYLWINSLKFYTVCFYHMSHWGLSKLSSGPLAFTSSKAFLKNKNISQARLLASFSAWVLRQNISSFIFYYLTKFYFLVAFTLWDVGQYVFCGCLLTRLWRHKFWN